MNLGPHPFLLILVMLAGIALFALMLYTGGRVAASEAAKLEAAGE